jgi:mRNA interferase MazF
MSEIIQRGDIWIIDLEPGAHREMHKKRPALIISDNTMNQQSISVIIIPISSQIPQKIGPEMVVVGKKEGLEKKSLLLPLFIRSIDQQRLIKKIGTLEKEKLNELIKAIKIVLSF